MIKKISFKNKGKITVYMEDGRITIIPLNKFPSIKNLSSAQRKKYTLLINPENNEMRGIAFFKDNLLFETKNFLEGKEIFA